MNREDEAWSGWARWGRGLMRFRRGDDDRNVAESIRAKSAVKRSDLRQLSVALGEPSIYIYES